MNKAVNEISCSVAASTLIFACSGAADVGAVADQAARKLARDGRGKMYCLAGIGAHVNGILETTRAAGTLLVIDGCATSCASKSLQMAGFDKFRHLQLACLGMEKGKTPPNEANIDAATAAANALLTAESKG